MEAIIRFKNGTVIEAEVNGSCFIVESKPEFPEVLKDVEIETADGKQTIEDAVLVECASIDRNYWFSLIEKPSEQKQAEEIAALKAENNMLIECILEMSEVVYGEDL